MSMEGHHLSAGRVKYPAFRLDFQLSGQYLKRKAFTNRMVIDHRSRFEDRYYNGDFVGFVDGDCITVIFYP